MINQIWIFHGAKSTFSSGVFTDKEIAENWIKKHKLAGVLTLYPVNEGVYDWAINNKLFTPKKDSERASEFI